MDDDQDDGVLFDFHPSSFDNSAWTPINRPRGQHHQASFRAREYARRDSESWDANTLNSSHDLVAPDRFQASGSSIQPHSTASWGYQSQLPEQLARLATDHRRNQQDTIEDVGEEPRTAYGQTRGRLAVDNLPYRRPSQIRHQPQNHWHRIDDIEEFRNADDSSTPHAQIDLTGSPNSHPLARSIAAQSTRDLPEKFHRIFPYPAFNSVQSKCFDSAYNSDDNFVLSSPTGSGKTAIMELAICRLINSSPSGEFKIVYQGLTKALCSERQRDWEKKFGPLGVKCSVFTGDSDASLPKVRDATIIVTTPEKWDSMTRSWKDHAKLMKMVKLFLIDEVHMLREERGATLEAIVSRTKSAGSGVRFIALSATIPNAEDVAAWLGRRPDRPSAPAQLEHFGQEFRPVQLEKHVHGFKSVNANPFAFDKLLNQKLVDIIARYSRKRPIMVFCSTKKNTVATAQQLAKWWASSRQEARWWSPPRKDLHVMDKVLKECTTSGVAFHNASLSPEDRLSIERSYVDGDLNVICCTSTLAVGVNLPCHFVIIKGTTSYHNGVSAEMSDLDVLQMLGRAGRPQFGSTAVAVIMTRQENVRKWEKLVSGQEQLESCLHLNLLEHINAEIVLGTITHLETAMQWLRGTFFFVRYQKNPQHYKLPDVDEHSYGESFLESLCKHHVSLLQNYELVSPSTALHSTRYGESAAKFSVRVETARRFLNLPSQAKLSEVLSIIGQAEELKDFKFRSGEKGAYKELNKSSAIRFPIPVNLDLPAHKVSLLIQCILAGDTLPAQDREKSLSSQFQQDKGVIFSHIKRLIRCVVDFQIHREDSISLRAALLLCRSFCAEVWDDTCMQLKQIDNIGVVSARKLNMAGITTIDTLEQSDPHRIEMILGRATPFGRQVLERAKGFPKVRVGIKIAGKPDIQPGKGAKLNLEAEVAFMNDKPPETFKYRPVFVVFLAETSDGQLIHFARFSSKKLGTGRELRFSAHLISSTQSILCHAMCDEFAGSMRTASIHPTIPSVAWPTNQVLVPKHQDRSIAQSGKANVPQSSAKPETSRKKFDDEYGYDDIDDTEVLRAVQQAELESFTNVDDIIGNESTIRPILVTQCDKDSERSPERLPNGKYSCHHHCKDKSRCKHLCCREGIDKQRKKAKPRTDLDMEYPQHGKRLATGSRQLPLIFPGNNPAVNLTQQERHYRPDEWSFPDSEAGHESRASGTTDDRYGSQHGRHYREPQSSINPLRNCPFKIPAFKEQARVNDSTAVSGPRGSQQQRATMFSTQPPNFHRQPQTPAPAASVTADDGPRRFHDEMQGADAAVFDGFDDELVWHVVDATVSTPNRKERADHKRKIDVLEPQSPANNRSKASRRMGDERANLSSPMFVPLTPGSLASQSMHDVMANDLSPDPIACPQSLIRSIPQPTASSSRPAARSDGGAFVNVHAMGQPSESNEENNGQGPQIGEENDTLRKLHLWLGDCVEFE